METGLEKKIARLTEAQKLTVGGYIDFLIDEENKKMLVNEPEAIYQASRKNKATANATPVDVENVISETKEKTKGKKLKREFGSLKGLITYIADDFDAPMEEFKDYM
jgi:hypothetical protein